MRIYVPPSRKPPEAPLVQEWLDRHTGLGALAGQAMQLADWDRALKKNMPAALHAAITVVGVKYSDGRGTLHLLTASSAVAARLRQMQPTLLAGLQQQGRNIDALRVRIQPGSPSGENDHGWNVPADQKTSLQRKITPGAIASLMELETGLPEGALKDAVKALVARHDMTSARRT